MKDQPIGTCIIVVSKDQTKTKGEWSNSENDSISKTLILLGKRKNAYQSGWYGMPGGRIDLGEKLETAAIRELTEETGIRTDQLEYVGVVKEFQNQHDFVHFGYVITVEPDMVKNVETDKCEGWNWFEINELPENILPGHKRVIEIFKSGNKGKLEDI